MVRRICKHCEKEFYDPSWKQRIYCSNECRWLHQREISGKDHYNWSGGRHKNKKGYIVVYIPEHPQASISNRKYVFEHRLVMEEFIGRYLYENEMVHHKNGIKNDNRIENLEIVSKKEHCSIHHPRTGVTKKCRICGKKRYYSPSEVKQLSSYYLCRKCYES